MAANKPSKEAILAAFFDEGNYSPLFTDGAVSAAFGCANGQSVYGQDWSRFRDVRIQLVDGNTYAQLSAVDLIQQLHCVITLVYKDTALKTVNKEAFRECVKSLLKQSKMFTDKELDAMFA